MDLRSRCELIIQIRRGNVGENALYDPIVTLGNLNIHPGTMEFNTLRTFASSYQGNDVRVKVFCGKILGKGDTTKISLYSDIASDPGRGLNPNSIGSRILDALNNA